MLKSLKIKNFRCFEEFDLPQLGRVNLLVGKNNSGKTSVLEAVHILTSPNNIESFCDVMEHRGECSTNKEKTLTQFKFNDLFSCHKMEYGSRFEISGIDNLEIKNTVSFFCTDDSFQKIFTDVADGRDDKEEIQITNLDFIESQGNKYVLTWYQNNRLKSLLYFPGRTLSDNFPQVLKNSQVIYLNSLSVDTIIEQFNKIVLTPQEDIVYESLRTIEPGIERIAPVSTQGYGEYGNGGFVVSINKQRVPIGVMGYGIWRMLEITLSMVNIPSGGTLLIDEIDTGLHFSVMVDLWKLICKTAEKLDIQVFATTHNSDCWKSLAEVANSDEIDSDDITIHRIERGKKESIVFNEREMEIAAERDIEVR
jgi:AAA15 family ATPase/GTPase